MARATQFWLAEAKQPATKNSSKAKTAHAIQPDDQIRPPFTPFKKEI